MTHRGSCHCGRVSFDVEGEPTQLMECNCSHCSRKGFQLWFVPRASFRLLSGEADLQEYTFYKHAIQHRFCRVCGTQPFAYGEHPKMGPMAAVNARCLPELDRSGIKIVPVDGKSF